MSDRHPPRSERSCLPATLMVSVLVVVLAMVMVMVLLFVGVVVRGGDGIVDVEIHGVLMMAHPWFSLVLVYVTKYIEPRTLNRRHPKHAEAAV